MSGASGVPADVHERAVEAAIVQLELNHWDGYGCGTNGTSGCSRCYGPSPASVREVADEALTAAAPVLAEPYRAEIERLKAALAAALHALKTMAPTEAQRNDEARGIIRRALEARDD